MNKFIYIYSMKIKFLLFVLLLTSCSGKDSQKKEEALIKDLTRAAKVISERNSSHYQKVKKYYEANVSNEDIKLLYVKFTNIQHFKQKYQNSLLPGGEGDFGQVSKEFIESCFSQLNSKEKEAVRKSFKDSPIIQESVLSEIKDENTLVYELSLESEIIVDEIYQILLKDFSKERPGFKWEIFWE
jgi:hypothetical protein